MKHVLVPVMVGATAVQRFSFELVVRALVDSLVNLASLIHSYTRFMSVENPRHFMYEYDILDIMFFPPRASRFSERPRRSALFRVRCCVTASLCRGPTYFAALRRAVGRRGGTLQRVHLDLVRPCAVV